MEKKKRVKLRCKSVSVLLRDFGLVTRKDTGTESATLGTVGCVTMRPHHVSLIRSDWGGVRLTIYFDIISWIADVASQATAVLKLAVFQSRHFQAMQRIFIYLL